MLHQTTHLIRPVSRFQRAIHVRYDLRDPDIIRQYIPTQSTASAIDTILRNTQDESTQRSHVLHAAYGSGKSHLAVALAALLEKDKKLLPAVDSFVRQLHTADEQAGNFATDYLGSDKRLFPVVMSGNEGDFGTSILRALVRSLKETGIDDLQLQTRFEAALNTISRWQIDYPDVLKRLANTLTERTRYTVESLQKALQNHDNAAYQVFVRLYTELTAGAVFDPFTEQAPELVYRDVAAQLQDKGYAGIVVIWDEFGRFLEGNAAQAFGSEAAMLQDFAETCNHSEDDAQIHLLLSTHKELQGYASALPQSYQQEWSRIEGRFQRHNISTDPNVAYRLIAAAIQHTDEEAVHEYFDDDLVDWYVDWARDYHLFGMLPREDIRALIYDTFPLHPLAVFALAHVSSRVAQNERTMFTFITSDEPDGLMNLLHEKLVSNHTKPIIYVSDLWDYFEEAIRADIGGSGAHRHWAGVIHALDKVATDDDLGQNLIKSLGILTVCADVTTVRPTSELLSWSIGADNEEMHSDIVTTLDYLRRRKAIIHRQIDGYWTFIAGSDVNFEDELQKVLERTNPSPSQLRRLLEKYFPAPSTLARRYNQEYSMTRYFTGLYRWSGEMNNAPWDALIEQENTDGLVIYVLATDDVEWNTALEAVQGFERVVYVLPRQGQPLISLIDTLRELFALQELNNDARLRKHGDEERVKREINWLMEDAEGRLEQIVYSLTDPRQDSSLWIEVRDDKKYGYHIASPGQATKIVSDICQRIFPATPELNSEGLNRQNPSSQQTRAARMVIDAMFSREPDKKLGMEGYGAEVLALNSLVKAPGILRAVDEEGDEWEFDRPPQGEPITEVWDIIELYLDTCQDKTPVEPLLTKLKKPPYGLREGVLPILLASVMRERLKVTTVWKGRHAVGAVTGDVIFDIVDKPEDYAIEIGEWQPQYDYIWQALQHLFKDYIFEAERGQQPLILVSTAMLRWLQALPTYCRETGQLSDQAIAFRKVVRKSVREPAKALFEALPDILALTDEMTAEDVEQRIRRIMQEISNAYLDLQSKIETFVIQEFGTGLSQDGLIVLKSWLAEVSQGAERDIDEFKFGSLITQDVVDVIRQTSEGDSQFWNDLSEATVGVTLRDWNDETETRFRERLLRARDEVERDVQDLIEEDKAITFSIEMPEMGQQDFRFRSSDLSSQGQRILQNFKSTMDVAGRPLSIDERRKIALAFLIHIMGDEIE